MTRHIVFGCLLAGTVLGCAGDALQPEVDDLVEARAAATLFLPDPHSPEYARAVFAGQIGTAAGVVTAQALAVASGLLAQVIDAVAPDVARAASGRAALLLQPLARLHVAMRRHIRLFHEALSSGMDGAVQMQVSGIVAARAASPESEWFPLYAALVDTLKLRSEASEGGDISQWVEARRQLAVQRSPFVVAGHGEAVEQRVLTTAPALRELVANALAVQLITEAEARHR